jgi:pyrroloquinoline quinone (PQQ) biosynthesis protein C
MNLSEYVIEASAEQYNREMVSHPAFAALAQGTLQRNSYVAYLRETYHLIRHTTAVFARAASFLPDDHRALRGWLLEQALDEHNHDLLCMKDLEALGEDPRKFLAVPPRQGAWGLITQTFHVAQADPVSLLGYILTTEGVGAAFAARGADLLTSDLYGYKSNQVTFLRAHGGFDIKHADEVKRMMNELDADERVRDSILAVRRFSITYYARMLQDGLEGY